MAGTLFDDQEVVPENAPERPLADRMRPRTLEEVVGHRRLVGEDGFLRRCMVRDRLPSLIFWGPPGTGKTTLARIIAGETQSRFVPFSAVNSGIREVRQVMEDSRRLMSRQGRRTLLFVDEIHRFNRAQQDAFLPYVETGDIVLMGATTENPSFALNAALISRCNVVVLESLKPDEIEALVRRALKDEKRGLGGFGIAADTDALEALSQLSSGDARRALTLLEIVAEEASGRGAGRIDGAAVMRVAQRKVLLYDRAGEEHFNLISALHKSMRESDPDAAVYWLARMLAAGEDPLYIVRRVVRFATEDVGLADPNGLTQALAAWDAYGRLGSPEGELAVVQAVIYLSLAPKSNAVYRAYGRARGAVEERPADPVPAALRNAVTDLMKRVGYGEGYVYAHDRDEGVGGIQCLPDAICGERFYQPGDRGQEKELSRRLERYRDLRRAAGESLPKS